MTRLQQISIGAAACSAVLLCIAVIFQYLGGLAPCPLCIWQRWPHAIAIVLGLLAFFLPARIWPALGALVMAVGAGIALFHAGVEQGWWQGPDTCLAPRIAGLDSAELLDRILETPAVRCDAIAWSLFGLSMAAWNGLLSFAIALLWSRAYASSSASQYR